MNRKSIASIALGLVLALWHVSRVQGQDYRYALLELPLLDPTGPGSVTYSINSVGMISGESHRFSTLRAVMWDQYGTVTDLGTLGGPRSEGRGINNQGEVVGWSNFIPDNTRDGRAFLWRDGEMIDLGTLGGKESDAFAINDSSQVVGVAEAVEGGGGFIWENGEMRALPTLGRSGGSAYDINNASQIVGTSVNNEGWKKAVLWENGEVFALPYLGVDLSSAHAINELGQIVGQSKATINNTHAVAWVNGRIFDLHGSGLGPDSSAWGINDAGQVVGWVGTQPLGVKAFLWEQAGGMRTLDSLVPPRLRTNWTLSMAHDVNDAGQIAAYGYKQGQPLTLIAFLVNPVNPTMSLSAPSPGRAGTSNTITLTGATPGARVTFLYSRFGGGMRIPGCDLQQNALQLDSPTVIGTAIADQSGVATITRTVPPVARGQTILFQAVVQNECAISQLVVHTFE